MLLHHQIQLTTMCDKVSEMFPIALYYRPPPSLPHQQSMIQLQNDANCRERGVHTMPM